MADILIKNPAVYDPSLGISGEKTDILIQDGRISRKVKTGAKAIDAQGMVAMPLGVDIHSHFLQREIGIPPSEIGTEYARLGYGTINEASVYPHEADSVREEFSRIPVVDKLFLLLLANNAEILKKISIGEDPLPGIRELLSSSRAHGIKALNPGGLVQQDKEILSLNDEIPGLGITPRDILQTLIKAREKLKLPHPLHLHTNNLGRPGNFETTLESMDFSPLHIAHIQFSSYGGNSWENFCSEAESIAKKLNKKDITADMGQIIYGSTNTVTADIPFASYLASLQEKKMKKSNGRAIVPYTYRKDSGVNSVQWALGLEIALLSDPWKIFLSTDSPNGGSFHNYPKIVAWLMDRKYRNKLLEESHPWASQRTTLPSLDREFSLEDIAIMTRAAPGKSLGIDISLKEGNPGSLAIYDLSPEESSGEKIEKAFSSPKWVVKNGEVVVEDGKLLMSTG